MPIIHGSQFHAIYSFFSDSLSRALFLTPFYGTSSSKSALLHSVLAGQIQCSTCIVKPSSSTIYHSRKRNYEMTFKTHAKRRMSTRTIALLRGAGEESKYIGIDPACLYIPTRAPAPVTPTTKVTSPNLSLLPPHLAPTTINCRLA
jgi:hypothetical protein